MTAGIPSWKRILDIFGAGIALIATSPAMAIIAASVRVTSSGPVIFRARRTGKDGVEFDLFKFRTMVDGAGRLGPALTVANDPRVTPLGRWLRRTKLDELPEFWNVLRGEMSLVGPRPEDPGYAGRLRLREVGLLACPPGITSPGSLAYVLESETLDRESLERHYVHEVAPHKIELDGRYVRHHTLAHDLVTILKTPLAIIAALIHPHHRTP